MKRLFLAGLLFVCLPLPLYAQANGQLQIHYIDVGQGDAAVLISPLGEIALFDNGVLNQCGKPISYLQSLGITKIDYHIASHYHSDHIGCTAAVLGLFPLQRAAYDRGGSYSTATYANYVNAVGAKRLTALKGQTITLDAASATPVRITFIALNGNGIGSNDENDLSIVSLVRFGQFEAEFGGDLSGAGTGTVDPDPNACSYTVTPASFSAPDGGGDFSATVSTTSECAWAASSNASWISIVGGATGTGSGPVTMSVTANSGSARSGTVTIAGRTVTISQGGLPSDACPATPVPPAGATARCRDGVWSFSQNRSGTCSTHLGVACWVCPGVLCSAGATAVPLTDGPQAYADIESSVAPLVGQVEVYKVHHHGSKFSSNTTWLSLTKPRVGVVSVGSANPYGHPTTEALARLHTAGVKTYWTSTGNGASPTPGWDVVAGNVVITIAPQSSAFTVQYGSASEVFPIWGAGAALPPTVATGVASGVGQTTATLNVAVNPNGATTVAHFEYGIGSYTASTPGVDIGSGSTPVGIGAVALAGLTCNTTYHFRAVATSASGTSAGADAVFATANCRVTRTNDFDGDGRSDRGVFRRPNGMWIISGLPDRQWGLPGDIAVPGDYDGDLIVDVAVYRPSSGEWFVHGQTPVQWGRAGDAPVPADYNGDGTADMAVFRTTDGMGSDWYVRGQFVRSWGLRGDIPVPADYDGDGRADLAVFRPSTGVWHVAYSTSGFTATAALQWGTVGDVPVTGDFEGDRRADLAVFRPSTGEWYIAFSSSNYANTVGYAWGLPGDVPLALDHDGDGVDEIVVFRPGDGSWFTYNVVTRATDGRVWGLTGDSPVGERPQVRTATTADFDGDRRADVSVYRPAGGLWFVRFSATGYGTSSVWQWGLNTDRPVPGDYDGDRRADIAVYRPPTGEWFLRFSGTQFATSRLVQWGLPADLPVPADYDGDGVTDLAVYRPLSGEWFVRFSATDYATFSINQWGLPADVPVPADYDGDGRADFAVFRPSTGQWFLRLSSGAFGGIVVKQFGWSTDHPRAADFDGDGRADLGVYRPSAGLWYAIDALTSIMPSNGLQWGLSGDTPVPFDYDGDGIADRAVFRPASSDWFVIHSSDGGILQLQWGMSLDVPVGGI
jgi:beta-lactamase superfamily II metal-dependent hydrolase